MPLNRQGINPTRSNPQDGDPGFSGLYIYMYRVCWIWGLQVRGCGAVFSWNSFNSFTAKYTESSLRVARGGTFCPEFPALSTTDELWCNPDPCDSMQSENVPGDSGAELVPQESRVKCLHMQNVYCASSRFRCGSSHHNMYVLFFVDFAPRQTRGKKLFDVVGRFVLHWPAL